MGTAAGDYDRAIRTFIPGYEQMLSTIGSWLSQLIPQDGRIIDLGGGTGALAQSVLMRLPNVRIELWDVDPSMLDVARDRLSRFGERVSLRRSHFTKKWTDATP